MWGREAGLGPRGWRGLGRNKGARGAGGPAQRGTARHTPLPCSPPRPHGLPLPLEHGQQRDVVPSHVGDTQDMSHPPLEPPWSPGMSHGHRSRDGLGAGAHRQPTQPGCISSQGWRLCLDTESLLVLAEVLEDEAEATAALPAAWEGSGILGRNSSLPEVQSRSPPLTQLIPPTAGTDRSQLPLVSALAGCTVEWNIPLTTSGHAPTPWAPARWQSLGN